MTEVEHNLCALRTYDAFSCKLVYESGVHSIACQSSHPKKKENNTIATWSPGRPWDREGHKRQVSKEKKLVAFRREEIQKLEQQMSKGASNMGRWQNMVLVHGFSLSFPCMIFVWFMLVDYLIVCFLHFWIDGSILLSPSIIDIDLCMHGRIFSS